MRAYYNENDAFCAQWLRNLIAAGHIAPGDVDERSIVDVQPGDLAGYTQCHFFAGIGGWSLALRLAGWDDARPVFTGSCPCQPFSAAGQGKAADDERHLWPDWFRLIRVLRPPVVFGEQVEAAVGWGWLDLVCSDLGGEGYACGAAVLPACSVGAPHIRQRLWFVADANGAEPRAGRGDHGQVRGLSEAQREPEHGPALSGRGGADGLMADAAGPGRGAQPQWHAGTDGGQAEEPRRLCDAGELGHPDDARPQGRRVNGHGPDQRPAGAAGVARGMADASGGGVRASSVEARRDLVAAEQGGTPGGGAVGFWDHVDWIPCTDGKSRPIKPGLQPLAHGVSARVGKLRAAGNAIVAPLAAEFIKAIMNARG